MIESDTKLKDVLKQLQRIAGVSFQRKITHEELSKLAGVNKRVIDEWMRGAIKPPAMIATFELLSKLPNEDVLKVLDYWKQLDKNH
jgi:transcriptional regulator with XRE-family HTH domain